MLRFDASTRKKIFVVFVLLTIGFVTFREARWYVLASRLNNVLQGVPQFPEARDIFAIRPRIVAEARSLTLDPSKLEIEVKLEQHLSNGYALKEDQLDCWWFVMVTVKNGSRVASWERRIDNKVADTAKEELEKGGIVVKPKLLKPS